LKLRTRWKYDKIAPYLPRPAKYWLRKKLSVYWAKNDTYHQPEMDVLSLFVKQGDTVFDIGANIGEYTRKLSRLVGPQGKVVAFEPVPETMEILTASIADLANIVPMSVALSDSNGSGMMRIIKNPMGEMNLGNSTLDPHWEEHGQDREEKIEVKIATIDQLGISSVTFIKCDTEAHDYHVVLGADMTTRKFRPVWMIEIAGDADTSPITAYFDKLDYACYAHIGGVFRKRAVKLPPEPKADGLNYFFVPKDKVVNPA
jgi:FkbM family methyltransferase